MTFRVSTVLAALLLLALLWVGWPTPYRYDHWRYDGNDYPVRISRISGSPEVLTRVGWRPLRAAPATAVYSAPAIMDTTDTARRR